jgi:hypothetical protein
MQIFSSNGYYSTSIQPKFGVKPEPVELAPLMPVQRRLSDASIQDIQDLLGIVFSDPKLKNKRTNKAIVKLAIPERKFRYENDPVLAKYMEENKEEFAFKNPHKDDVEWVRDGRLMPSREFTLAHRLKADADEASSAKWGGKDSESQMSLDYEFPDSETSAEPEISVAPPRSMSRTRISVESRQGDGGYGTENEIIVAEPKQRKRAPKKSSSRSARARNKKPVAGTSDKPQSLSAVKASAQKSFERGNWYFTMPGPDGKKRLVSPFKLDANKRTIRRKRKPILNPPKDAQLTNVDTTHSKSFSRAGTPGNKVNLQSGKNCQHEDPVTGDIVITTRVFSKKKKRTH